MGKLIIPLSQLAGEDVAVDAVVSAEELRPARAEELSLGPISVTGTVSEANGEYLFQGRVSGAYNHACDRCLEAAEQPFDLEVVWVFAQGATEPSAEDVEKGLEEEPDGSGGAGGLFPLAGDEIDLRAAAWEEIVLAAPTKFLCREDCAGLCPVCGINLNHASCSCQETEAMSNSGLAGLANLFPELRPNRTEEANRAGTQETNRQN